MLRRRDWDYGGWKPKQGRAHVPHLQKSQYGAGAGPIRYGSAGHVEGPAGIRKRTIRYHRHLSLASGPSVASVANGHRSGMGGLFIHYYFGAKREGGRRPKLGAE